MRAPNGVCSFVAYLQRPRRRSARRAGGVRRAARMESARNQTDGAQPGRSVHAAGHQGRAGLGAEVIDVQRCELTLEVARTRRPKPRRAAIRGGDAHRLFRRPDARGDAQGIALLLRLPAGVHAVGRVPGAGGILRVHRPEFLRDDRRSRATSSRTTGSCCSPISGSCLLLTLPFITMRLFAEERKLGTDRVALHLSAARRRNSRRQVPRVGRDLPDDARADAALPGLYVLRSMRSRCFRCSPATSACC